METVGKIAVGLVVMISVGVGMMGLAWLLEETNGLACPGLVGAGLVGTIAYWIGDGIVELWKDVSDQPEPKRFGDLDD